MRDDNRIYVGSFCIISGSLRKTKGCHIPFRSLLNVYTVLVGFIQDRQRRLPADCDRAAVNILIFRSDITMILCRMDRRRRHELLVVLYIMIRSTGANRA